MNKLLQLLRKINPFAEDSEFLRNSNERDDDDKEFEIYKDFNDRCIQELTEFEEQLIDLDNYNHKGQ